MTRRSLKLSPKEWRRLQDIAVVTNSLATKGTTTGQPTWRALVRRIAQGELAVGPAAKIIEIEPIGINASPPPDQVIENDVGNDHREHSSLGPSLPASTGHNNIGFGKSHSLGR